MCCGGQRQAAAQEPRGRTGDKRIALVAKHSIWGECLCFKWENLARDLAQLPYAAFLQSTLFLQNARVSSHIGDVTHELKKQVTVDSSCITAPTDCSRGYPRHCLQCTI